MTTPAQIAERMRAEADELRERGDDRSIRRACELENEAYYLEHGGMLPRIAKWRKQCET